MVESITGFIEEYKYIEIPTQKNILFFLGDSHDIIIE